MKRTFEILVIVILSVMLLTAAPGTRQIWAEPQDWSQTYGGIGGDSAYALVQTSDGGYALAGRTNSFGAGSDDFWLVKTDANGTKLWDKTYGGTNSDVANALVQTGDDGYALAGRTNSFGAGSDDFWLIKTDSSGNIQWNKTYGGTDDDAANALVQTSDGGYTVAGYTRSFGLASNYDFWLIKTDSSGNMLWNKTYGREHGEWAAAIVQTDDGGYALAGCAYPWGTSATTTDFWLVKTDTNGTKLWDKLYGSTSYFEYAYAFVQTSDGGYALAGDTYTPGAPDSHDFWLVKTSANGTKLWDKFYGGTQSEVSFALVQNADSGYALAGYTKSFGAGIRDAWLVKTDAFGNSMWNVTYGGTYSDVASALVQTSDGRYALAGGTGSFGAGSDDAWLIKTSLSLIEGDINLDGTVDIFDIVIVALEFSHPPPPIVDARADVNKDGVVDIFDIAVIAVHFGETA